MRRSVIIVLALFSLLLYIGCSDDDNPTTATAPCDDPDVSCATVTVLTTEQWSSYNDVYGTQTFSSFPIDNSTIKDYAPGRRVIITVNFQPPLRVTATYPFDLYLRVSGPAVTCEDYGQAWMPSTITTEGKWPKTTNLGAYALRECTTGGSSFWTQMAYQKVLVKGHVLRSLRLEFTVPETYTDGDGAGSAVLPADANITEVEWLTFAAGDHRANPPLVQQK